MDRRYALRRAFAVPAMAVLLLALAFLAPSCGPGGGEEGGGGSEVRIESREDVDALLEDLDAAMDSVDADDFSDDKLSDGELGLE